MVDSWSRGSASEWHPDELPGIYADHYEKAPNTTILHECFDLTLSCSLIDPQLPGITTCTVDLHGESRYSKPDYRTFGGMASKRKDKLTFWFHSTPELPRDIANALATGAGVFLRLSGERLYYGKALVCTLEWWAEGSPELVDELADVTPGASPNTAR